MALHASAQGLPLTGGTLTGPLVVTGSVTASGGFTVSGGGVAIASNVTLPSGNFVSWTSRTALSAPGDGILQIEKNAGGGAQNTVAALPAASSALTGARAFVTDANASTFGTTAAGAGANKVPVYCNGTAWVIG